jgi:hypothetical protein
MSKLIGFICLIVVGVLAACSTKKDSSDIAGTWYLVTNDSVYDEAIFTKNNFWAWSEKSGQLFGKYKIQNDSFKYLQLNGQLMRALSFKRESEDEFLISDAGFESHYFRLHVPLDTARLINASDMQMMDSYRTGIRDRRLKWKTNR